MKDQQKTNEADECDDSQFCDSCHTLRMENALLGGIADIVAILSRMLVSRVVYRATPAQVDALSDRLEKRIGKVMYKEQEFWVECGHAPPPEADDDDSDAND